MSIKKFMREKLFLTIIILTIATKLLEWAGQYLVGRQVLILSTTHAFLQILFILTVAGILFWFFNFIKAKKQTFLLIPVLAYFIKEVYNFIFIYGRVLNEVTLIALIVEPLLIYGMIHFLIKPWLKLK